MSVDKNYCKFSHCLNIAEIVSQAEDRGAGGGGGGGGFDVCFSGSIKGSI